MLQNRVFEKLSVKEQLYSIDFGMTAQCGLRFFFNYSVPLEIA